MGSEVVQAKVGEPQSLEEEGGRWGSEVVQNWMRKPVWRKKRVGLRFPRLWWGNPRMVRMF